MYGKRFYVDNPPDTDKDEAGLVFAVPDEKNMTDKDPGEIPRDEAGFAIPDHVIQGVKINESGFAFPDESAPEDIDEVQMDDSGFAIPDQQSSSPFPVKKEDKIPTDESGFAIPDDNSQANSSLPEIKEEIKVNNSGKAVPDSQEKVQDEKEVPDEDSKAKPPPKKKQEDEGLDDSEVDGSGFVDPDEESVDAPPDEENSNLTISDGRTT